MWGHGRGEKCFKDRVFIWIEFLAERSREMRAVNVICQRRPRWRLRRELLSAVVETEVHVEGLLGECGEREWRE